MKTVEDSLKRLHEKIDKKVISDVKFVMDEDDNVIVVNYTENGDSKVMIIDTGCPKSLVGLPWLFIYLKDNSLL